MIGLGSYSFFWAHKSGLTLVDALRATHAHGVELFQICDYAPIESMTSDQLHEVRALAEKLGIQLELGTRGIATQHLQLYLSIAEHLGCTLVRSMVDIPAAQATPLLAAIAPQLGEVTLALETYERIPTTELVALVRGAQSPDIGICLDPANTIAILETPQSVIDMTEGLVVNVHIKDFEFTRRDGWVGFTLAGCPLGEGLLDLERLLATAPTDANLIIEHWLPWQGDDATTVALETEWTTRNLEYLRKNS